MSQSLVVKLYIHVHSNIIQKKFWTTAFRIRKGCNLISKAIFDSLPYFENINKNWKDHRFSALSRYFWSNRTYHEIREKSKLKAQETIDCFTLVLARYRTVKRQMKKHLIKYYNRKTGKYYYPTKLYQLKKRIKFRRPWIYLTRGRDWSFTHNRSGHQVISLGTVYGRVKLPYKVPPYFKQYIKPTTKFGAIQLLHSYPSKHYKRGRWTIHLTCTVKTKPLIHNHVRHLVSSDRGIDNVIWTYDNHNRTFHVSGKNVLRKRIHYKHLRTQLQKCHSHSALRKIRYISHKENRWRQNVNYNILKALYKKYPSLTEFGLEDLKGIRNALKKVRQERRYTQISWDYYDLESKWEAKANLHQSSIQKLDPHNTSSRCPVGHEIKKSNRHHNKHAYICKKHHCQYNDDMVGALNIYDLLNMSYCGIKNPNFKYGGSGKS